MGITGLTRLDRCPWGRVTGAPGIRPRDFSNSPGDRPGDPPGDTLSPMGSGGVGAGDGLCQAAARLPLAPGWFPPGQVTNPADQSRRPDRRAPAGSQSPSSDARCPPGPCPPSLGCCGVGAPGSGARGGVAQGRKAAPRSSPRSSRTCGPASLLSEDPARGPAAPPPATRTRKRGRRPQQQCPRPRRRLGRAHPHAVTARCDARRGHGVTLGPPPPGERPPSRPGRAGCDPAKTKRPLWGWSQQRESGRHGPHAGFVPERLPDRHASRHTSSCAPCLSRRPGVQGRAGSSSRPWLKHRLALTGKFRRAGMAT